MVTTWNTGKGFRSWKKFLISLAITIGLFIGVKIIKINYVLYVAIASLFVTIWLAIMVFMELMEKISQ